MNPIIEIVYILKRIVKQDSTLWKFLGALRRLFNFGIEENRLNRILDTLAKEKKEVFFIQIGSNDATHGDPLRPFILQKQWAGIMVEPVKYVFDRLEKNYHDFKDLIFENVAIARENGIQDFYYLAESEDDLPPWYDQLGSFSMDHILRHADQIPNIWEYIVSTKVPCMTFQALCDKHKVEHIDLIQIDVEGYDFEIIKTIDFKRYRPTLIHYEHMHLSQDDRVACFAYLNSRQYSTMDLYIHRRLYLAAGDNNCPRYRHTAKPAKDLIPPQDLQDRYGNRRLKDR